MAKLQISKISTYSIDATVRESDEYTEQVYVKFERHYIPEGVSGCNEFFLTPSQLADLGNFLVNQAAEISKAQALRSLQKRVSQDSRQG